MNKISLSKWMGLSLILIVLLAACGGSGDNGSSSDGDASNVDAEPTNTPFPTFEFVAPTNPPVFNQSAESTDEADAEATPEADEDTVETIELDPTKVERGLGRYEALECAVCHGEAGEGTEDIGGLIDMNLTEDEFTTFMRSGGTIGSSHQYSTDRLSRNGTENLYQYLLSLSQDS